MQGKKFPVNREKKPKRAKMTTKTVSHSGPHGSITMTVEAHTSDGEERANATPLATTVVLPTISYDIDDNARVSALYNMGLFLKGAGQTINVISRDAAYPNNDVTQRINDIITAANALGAVQQPPFSGPFKTYISTDYNVFTSILNNVIAGVNALGLPGNTIPPTAGATNLSVAGGGVCSCNTGTWVGSPTGYTYQWLRDGVAIAGATTNSHPLVAADIGHMLSCQVVGTNAVGHSTVVSNTIGPVVA